MPRKGYHGIDYEDDYDDYEDYYDDLDVDENEGEAPATDYGTTNPAIEPGIWRCSICTYDNGEPLSSCDICGSIRTPVDEIFNSSGKKTVDGMWQGCGASILAKSIFSSLSCRINKNAGVFELQSGDCVMEDENKLHKLGTVQEPFHELIKAFSSHSHYHIDIAPFKFDVPSPDDLVISGLHSSKRVSKDNLSSKLSSSGNAKTGVQKKQLSAENPDRPVMPKDKKQSLDATNRSVASASKPENPISSAKALDIKSLSIQEDRLDIKNEINNSFLNVGKPENFTCSSTNMLNVKTDNVKKEVAGKAMGRLHYKPENWMLPAQSENSLTQLNVAVVGHVDSGKSTLSGRLLHLLGQISQKQMHKNEKESKLKGKGSFSYAWALDESPEERERGITMTVAVAYFESKKYHIVVLDSPGHQDFVPNMISGATQADAAILVVDASSGSFEAGMAISGGQTREHAQLIRSFGVDQVIVAINKMDTVAFSKERFDTIKAQLGSFLHSCGFKDASLYWIPLSAVGNQNLVAPATDVNLLGWYQGPYLLDAIDSLEPPTRDLLKPLVMPICDVIKSHSLGQTSACGKLEAGAVRSGVKVLAMPSGNLGTVRSLERDSQPCSIARAGDSVAITLQGIDVRSILAGAVLCHPDFPASTAKHLELKILTLEGASPILIGSQLEFHIHHAKEVVRVLRIVSILDQKTGEVIKKAPRCLIAKQSGVLEVVLHEAVCVDEFKNCKALGRVSLRSSGRTVALGIVSRLIDNS